MICKNCGKKIPNGANVCPECGRDLAPNVPQANGKAVIMKETTDHAIIWYLKKKAVYITMAAIVILVVVVNLLSAAVSFFNRIDFTQYVQVEATGYNGQGSLAIRVDSEGLSDKLFGKAPDELEWEEQQKLALVSSLLRENIEIEGKTSDYSNGDEVVLRITDLEAVSEAANRKSKSNDEIPYTVEDLKDADVITFKDLFDVSFAGFNGDGRVLVTPKTVDVPWEITYYYDAVYIDNCAYNVYSQADNADALSNGDTVTVGIASEGENNAKYLLDTYGIRISDEAASYTVSGLSDLQSVDVMSLVEITFHGVDGSAEIGYGWSQEEYQQGNVRIVPGDSHSNAFNLVVSGVPSDERKLVILSDGDALPTTDRDLGWFYLTADKEEGISAGETITVTIHADSFDSLDNGALAPYGVEFAELEKSALADVAMIPRLVTALDQVNEQSMKTLALSLTDSIKEGLEEDWSRIVHGNGNFACYDQTITAGPNPVEAHLVCTDPGSNSYSIWVVYATQVTDSELDKAQLIYTTVRLDKPVVFQDEGKTVDYLGNAQMEFGQNLEFVQNSWWYPSENSVTIYF